MKEIFLEVFNKEYTDVYFSPGRINLIGEHIDYNGGNVLPMTIDKGTYGYIRKRNDKKVRLYSINFKSSGIKEIDIENIKYNVKNEWANYVAGVIYTFLNDGYTIDFGFDLLINGTIPNGSGLSSSASLEVLVGRILIDINKLNISDEKLSLLTQKAENDFMDVNCGIMDQFIIANGSQNGPLLLDTQYLKFQEIDLDLKDNVLVVINSKKKRGLVDSAYNERRISCEKVLEKAKRKYNVVNLCGLNIKQLNELELSDDEYKRAAHVINEQIRVNKSVEQIEKGDIKGFGLTLYDGHESLKNLFEVSCSELDFIVKQCAKHEFIGARMTGAGFGGCVIAIVNKERTSLLEQIKVEYYKKFKIYLDFYIVQASNKTQKIN